MGVETVARDAGGGGGGGGGRAAGPRKVSAEPAQQQVTNPLQKQIEDAAIEVFSSDLTNIIIIHKVVAMGRSWRI